MEKFSFQNVDKEIFDNLKHRIDECFLLTNMLNSASDFLLYGPSGSGKTTLVKELLRAYEIKHIRINCIQAEILDNYAMSLVPQFMLTPPNQEFQQDLLLEYLKDRIRLYDEKQPIFSKVYDKIGPQIALNIVQVFGKQISDLGQLIHISWQIYQIICLSAANASNIDHILTSRVFKTVKQILLENPIMCEGNIEVLQKKVNDVMMKNEQEVQFEKQRGTIINLPSIPSIILIACWIGNRNVEKTDHKLFKERKVRYKRKKPPKAFDIADKIKPIKINRLLALSDSLLSLYLPDLQENNQYDRSVDFFNQLAILEQYNFITKTANQKDELNQIKYVCNLEQASIQQLAQKLEINIFLHIVSK
ncbi:P-loop containing nucleoside triphosphate hydrolase [Pseudocohnilembus persalinus]|uniref:p-loop containing nucleoside triphosphate hydrolase n=1 Tax=Pseudocohnilembus persalinus TaxID=266149 RepID=A0A0V0R610_PSEPJ|nr:P-loop containing nucleoside triphosphate hydrolase [Pseudocohnilembus persalinus]|eukprot:KRX09940.1 P-loop containing nucleoside triphosphate hydrolase [Pseudocohnilembus persalinus]